MIKIFPWAKKAQEGLMSKEKKMKDAASNNRMFSTYIGCCKSCRYL